MDITDLRCGIQAAHLCPQETNESKRWFLRALIHFMSSRLELHKLPGLLILHEDGPAPHGEERGDAAGLEP